MTTAPDALHTLAHAHLPADIAGRWTGLLRPAAHLRRAGATDPVVGRLGGLPRLPEGMEWPVWEGHGPLSLVAAVDSPTLPRRTQARPCLPDRSNSTPPSNSLIAEGTRRIVSGLT
ncbi:DUF1963 domain-containing protein [Streptomyces sp. NPDC005355]|uniref:DUF1963 domain-containing protein n=1 Tax=Streptomyces sp. NPDC005355 TaxID=3157038 RepID=UPI0033BB0B0C